MKESTVYFNLLSINHKNIRLRPEQVVDFAGIRKHLVVLYQLISVRLRVE